MTSNSRSTTRHRLLLLLFVAIEITSAAVHYHPYPTIRRGDVRSSSAANYRRTLQTSSSTTRTRKESKSFKNKKARHNIDDNINTNVQGKEREIDPKDMSFEELQQQMPLWAKFIVNSIDVCFATATSCVSGLFMGYTIGTVTGLPKLFKSPPSIPGTKFAGLRAMNSKAIGSGKKWAELNAAFSGFHAVVRVTRNGKEDRWNGIVGSGLAGAYLARNEGPQNMLRNGVSFASFSYLIDMFMLGGRGATSSDEDVESQSPEFDFREVEVKD